MRDRTCDHTLDRTRYRTCERDCKPGRWWRGGFVLRPLGHHGEQGLLLGLGGGARLPSCAHPGAGAETLTFSLFHMEAPSSNLRVSQLCRKLHEFSRYR
jgi:hypothetical protein